MLDKRVTDIPDLLLLHGNGSLLLKKARGRYLQRKTDAQPGLPDWHALQTLNSLTNSWLFRDFRPLCSNSDIAPALQALKAPGYRASRIPRPAQPLFQLLHHPHEQSTLDILDADSRQLAASLANHSPFMHKATWYHNFDDLLTLETDNLLALLASTILNQQIITHESKINELELFYQGVCSGYINMQLGKTQGLNPLHSFLAPLLHHIALIIIRRELQQCTQLPKASTLLDEIDSLHLKLAYWIAKDWGLPDNILSVLKQRFLSPETAGMPVLLLQKSENAWLAIRLCQQGYLTRQQVSGFLELMQVSYPGLNASLDAICH